MLRYVMAVVAGLAVWFLVVFLASPIVRVLWPEYVRVAAEMHFTLGMKLLRLAIGAVATIAAGALLLVFFIPEHISLWNKFPIWYHLTFLLSLVPLCAVGGRISRRAAA